MIKVFRIGGTGFQSVCTMCGPPGVVREWSDRAHPHQYFLRPDFLFLTDVTWYPILVLICMSLMTNNIEHLFYMLIYYLVHLFWWSIPIILKRSHLFSDQWGLRVLYVSWTQVLYQIYDLQIFFPSLLFFIFLTVFFKKQTFFSCDKEQFVDLLFYR